MPSVASKETRIEPVLRSYAAYFRDQYQGKFQLVVVLNGCRDNTLGVVQKVGLEVGKKVISIRRRLREMIAYFGGKVIHPVLGLPGGVSKGLKAEDLTRFQELAKDALAFALFTLQVFKDIVLRNAHYVELIASDTYTHRTYYMGLVDAQNKVNFYDGMIRVSDQDANEVEKFEGKELGMSKYR